jgi:PAS domain S-box-containing protein
MKSNAVSFIDGVPANGLQSTSLQKLLDFSPDVICAFDAEGNFLSVSAAAKALWGYYPQELAGLSFLHLVIDADKAATKKAVQQAMSHAGTTHFKNHYTCKDGSTKPFLWSVSWDSEEKVMYAVAKDACAQKEAETQTLLQQKRLKRAYNLAGIAWWELDIAKQQYTCSEEVFQLYGVPIPADNTISVKQFLTYVYAGDLARLQYDMEQLCTDTYFQYQHRINKGNGDVAYLIHYAEMVRNEMGEPVMIQGVTKNITDTKLHELQLQASEQKLQQYVTRLHDILESIGDGFYAVDHNWNITYWNKKAEELLLRQRDEALGKNLWDIYKEAIPLKFHSEYTRAMNQKTAVQFEEYFEPLHKWFEVAAYPSNEGLAVYFKDVTSRKEQETNLKISNERFEFVSKATTDAVWDWDIINNTNYFNEAFTKLFGHSAKSQSTTDSWSEHLHPGDKNKVNESINRALANPAISTWEEAYRFIKANGQVAHVYDRATIIRNEGGKAIRMVGAMQDITKIKETEKAISRAIISTQEKERSEIGKELHDNVNQILTTVKLYIENIRDYPDHRAHFIDKSITLAQRAINEIRQLSRQLVTPVMADLGFEATLQELVEHYQSLNLFAFDLYFDVAETRVDKNMQLTIFRIIQEQLTNVIKHAKATQVTVKVAQEQQALLVQVYDNGVGFDSSRQITGLGLRNIEHRSHLFNGKMTLQSAPGEGCQLQIIFPLST